MAARPSRKLNGNEAGEACSDFFAIVEDNRAKKKIWHDLAGKEGDEWRRERCDGNFVYVVHNKINCEMVTTVRLKLSSLGQNWKVLPDSDDQPQCRRREGRQQLFS